MPNGLYAAAKSSLVASSIVVGGLLGLRAMRYVNGGSVKTRKLPPVPKNHESIEPEGASEVIALLRVNINELTERNERLRDSLGVANARNQALQEKMRHDLEASQVRTRTLLEQNAALDAKVQELEALLAAKGDRP